MENVFSCGAELHDSTDRAERDDEREPSRIRFRRRFGARRHAVRARIATMLADSVAAKAVR